jgi:hypothetical protein
MHFLQCKKSVEDKSSDLNVSSQWAYNYDEPKWFKTAKFLTLYPTPIPLFQLTTKHVKIENLLI